MAHLAELQEVLGVIFHDSSLLETAVVHSSYINENPGQSVTHNERLEFLGDAVLGMSVAEKLYRDFPTLDEGDMSSLRAVLVNRKSLARIAMRITLGDYLKMGKGEDASGGRNRSANLAGALEAVIGAVYVDRGLDDARDMVLRLLDEELVRAVSRGTPVDYKSRLQEAMHAGNRGTPTYRLVETSGPDHDRVFTTEVMEGETVLGRGTGKSKKIAETEAARLALEKLSGTNAI